MKILCPLLLFLGAAIQLPSARAQRPDAAILPTGLGSLPIGARLRVTDTTLHAYEGRLAQRIDSVVWLESGSSVPRQRVRLTEIRTLELYAAPASRSRTVLTSVGVGAILGMLAGAAAHGDARESPGLGSPPSRGENIASGAVLGGAIGGMFGHYVFARARWQPLLP